MNFVIFSIIKFLNDLTFLVSCLCGTRKRSFVHIKKRFRHQHTRLPHEYSAHSDSQNCCLQYLMWRSKMSPLALLADWMLRFLAQRIDCVRNFVLSMLSYLDQLYQCIEMKILLRLPILSKSDWISFLWPFWFFSEFYSCRCIFRMGVNFVIC